MKIFSKGTGNFKLTRGEFVALVVVLRFLLVKKIELIKTAHALYRDNGPLSVLDVYLKAGVLFIAPYPQTIGS